MTCPNSKIDLDGKGYVDQATVIRELQKAGEGSNYDQIRATLRECNIDASGRVELEDYVEVLRPNAFLSWMAVDVQLVSKLREGRNRGAFEVSQHKITVHGSSANVSHTINEDERTEFTRHMNNVLAGDPDIGSRLPFPLHSMQIFDECKGIHTLQALPANIRWTCPLKTDQ